MFKKRWSRFGKGRKRAFAIMLAIAIISTSFNIGSFIVMANETGEENVADTGTDDEPDTVDEPGTDGDLDELPGEQPADSPEDNPAVPSNSEEVPQEPSDDPAGLDGGLDDGQNDGQGDALDTETNTELGAARLKAAGSAIKAETNDTQDNVISIQSNDNWRKQKVIYTCTDAEGTTLTKTGDPDRSIDLRDKYLVSPITVSARLSDGEQLLISEDGKKPKDRYQTSVTIDAEYGLRSYMLYYWLYDGVALSYDQLWYNWLSVEICSDITDATTVTFDKDSYVYTGEEIKPKITVKNGNITVGSANYKAEYSNNINAGTATVKITGIEEYRGTVTSTFKITPYTLTNGSVTLESDEFTYKGKEIAYVECDDPDSITEIKPDVVVKFGSTPLTPGTDYEVSYANNESVGLATVTVTGKGNFTGTVEKKFLIASRSIKVPTVTFLPSSTYYYTGYEVMPEMELKLGDYYTLVRDEDYTVSYKNNKGVGTATAVITGIGFFNDTRSENFTIANSKKIVLKYDGETTKKDSYPGKVTITADNYLISDDAESSFESEYLFTGTGKNQTITLYLIQDVDSGATAPTVYPVTVTVNFDGTEEPEEPEEPETGNNSVSINIMKKTWSDFQSKEKFYKYTNEAQQITLKYSVTSKDSLSTLQYYISTEPYTSVDSLETAVGTGWKNYNSSQKPEIVKNKLNYVYAKLTTTGGKTVYASTAGIFHDNKLPTELKLNVSPKDTTANVTLTGIDGESGIDKYYIYVLPKDETAPDKEAVVDKGLKSTDGKFKVEDLTASTAYIVYAVIVDKAGNISEVTGESTKALEPAEIHITMNGATVVPAAALNSIKDRNITLYLDMSDGITWVENGLSFTDEIKDDIDFRVRKDTKNIPSSLVNEVAGVYPRTNISLAHDGAFGFTAILNMYMGDTNAGMYGNLYYYNEDEGRLDFVDSMQISDSGYAQFEFRHASDYTIVMRSEALTEKTAMPVNNGEEGTLDDTTYTPDVRPWNTSSRLWILLISIISFAMCGVILFMPDKKRAVA